MVVGGDVNSKSPWWGSPTEDRRGKRLAGLLNELDLQVLNEGSTPTFDTVRGDKTLTSFVDITACKHSIPQLSQKNKVNLSWWSEELANLKRGVVTKKRRIRSAPQSCRRSVVDEYLAEGDNGEHRAVREQAARLSVRTALLGNEDPPFTALELKQAAHKFNPKKAPGADGLTADICAQTVYHKPEFCLSLVNKCLTLGYFPVVWKQATVVVLRKPGKDEYTRPKSYRPIGLLPVMGKILERLIVNRLMWHLVPRLSTRQYGFLPQRSTEDSLYDLVNHIREKLKQKKIITLVSLDIEGAFDSAWWPMIRVRLAEENCPGNIQRILGSYLENRSVSLRYLGEEVKRRTTKGCVQGSTGGPIL
ncbi:hypothetical protein K1T71_011001 [Dendrolimus kikuchii]|uniref:Uncharacterized protein n=1 Tax=Dendrolimus kikuchii TaxID=765133 RepID=A0ACC1CQM8_9NEOP|nr:hypothetical protein K1T71_011001 [Dendrolimus kikuchii]